MNFQEFLNYKITTLGEFTLTPYRIIYAIIVLIVARIVFQLINRFFITGFLKKRRKIDIGRIFALKQFLKYIIYTIAILLALQAIGVQISVLLAGSAALLVGIGLGLQEPFKDIVSGFILLVDGSVEVGDDVMIDGTVGRVKSIGLRTSFIETRDNTVKIVPNSIFVSGKISNWSHNDNPTRFQIKVGVSYSSDVKKVENILLMVAESHEKVLNHPVPIVQFENFGDSSLDFILHFYSLDHLRIEFVKSDIRFSIVEAFNQNGIEISFPQRDLWIKSRGIQSIES